MNRNDPRRRLLVLATILGGAALLANLILNLAPDSPAARLRRGFARGPRDPFFLLTSTDRMLAAQAPTGNVVLRFEGFADAGDLRRGRLGGRELASLLYFRCVHQLYPQRAYAGPEDQVVIHGDEFLAAPPFAPPPAWRRKHGILTTITFRRDPQSGQVRYQAEPEG